MTFYFYDLETSGLDPRAQRIMQFAGMRTDQDFNPIGEPLMCYVALSDDVLPDPYAIMVTGITPQKTLEEGYSEADFLKVLHDHAFQRDTAIVGFNNIRFDDEFIRSTLYRNFYDAYEWHWKDGRSRWDLMDVVRMTRALRPEGIKWPVDKDGNATNRLELLTKENKLEHLDAHDALSDVRATIAVAKLIKQKQPKLFDFLLRLRDKREVAKLLDVKNPQPLVYTSGKLSSEFAKTSAVIPVAPHPTNPSGVLVYDLRHDPGEFADLSIDELRARAFMSYEESQKKELKRLPVKAIFTNKSPALAPLGVLDAATQERIKLRPETVQKHLKKLAEIKGFGKRLHEAWSGGEGLMTPDDVDGQLYAAFLGDNDRSLLSEVRGKNADSLKEYAPIFHDERLTELLVRYKARNFSRSLSASEREYWEGYRKNRIMHGVAGAMNLEKYAQTLAELTQRHQDDEEKRFLLEELRLYAESIVPEDS